MLARVILLVSSKPNAVLVPKDAIVLGRQTPLVYVVDAAPSSDANAGGRRQGVAREVVVELGIEQNNLIQVKGNIKPHEQVVVQGNERLRGGMTVAIAESAVK